MVDLNGIGVASLRCDWSERRATFATNQKSNFPMIDASHMGSF